MIHPAKLTSVDQLRLDPSNPRLPEGFDTKNQSQLFDYLAEHAVLDELISSMLNNGFFAAEPLVALVKKVEGRHTVIEGNRRLAALMAIRRVDAAGGYSLREEPGGAQLAALNEVPVVLVDEREEVEDYLGFRHVGGLKPWSPEAKARYMVPLVDELHARGDDDAFFSVGRRFGSNSQGVRSAYIATKLLRIARSEGADVGYVREKRFGVWLRCMSSKDIRAFVEMAEARTIDDVKAALRNVQVDRVAEVVSDLTPADSRRAVLSDSRNVTRYAAVLVHKSAYSVLRDTGDLRIAMRVLDRTQLDAQIDEAALQVKAIRNEVESEWEDLDEATRRRLVESSARLARGARALSGTIKELSSDDE